MAEHDHNHHDHDHDHDHSPVPESSSARGASVRLRQADARTGGSSMRMDPANQSLADALRFTYGLLRIVMVLLVGLFVFSGFKSVQEGERGIKVLLGRPTATNVPPGFVFNAPYPIGELVRIGSGTQETKIGLAYMPYSASKRTDADAIAAKVDDFTSDGKLKPGQSGSNITADLNIAHTQWTVNYQRTDHQRWAENILPEHEDRIVRTAVMRGVVQTIAGVTIDDLLRQSGDTVSARVREIAQRTLDDMQSGITIDRVALSRKVPPIYLVDKFASVQASAQNAGKERENALLDRDQALNEVAGPAAPVLIAEIAEYERLIELGEAEAAEARLAGIDAILEGRAVEIDGQVYAAGLVSGNVSEVLQQARSEASTMVSQAIAERDYFRAKLAQFQANPRLMIARDWSAAMTEFMSKDFVQAMWIPEGVSIYEMLINEDPAIARELDRARKRAEAEAAADDREKRFIDDLFRSKRGIEEPEE